MRNIGESRIYVVPELSTDNEQWINPDFGSPDLRMHYDNIRQMVKEKTGRAMQEKERERKGKNGKIVKIAGCSPIREGVLLVRSDTTLADVRKFGEECQRRWGITPLQIFLHKDEGH
ncbi:mobilization protein, partial [Escherichia coli]|nr:mobilization protein [Escherichia coli]